MPVIKDYICNVTYPYTRLIKNPNFTTPHPSGLDVQVYMY